MATKKRIWQMVIEHGQRTALVGVIRDALRQLGYDDPEAATSAWIVERQGAVVALRDLCASHGDNDWPDDLDLSDVINKHLANHLH
jgi:predicted secreted protein